MSSNCYYCGGHPDEVVDLRRRVAELEAECNRWAEASIAEDGRRARWRAALEEIQRESMTLKPPRHSWYYDRAQNALGNKDEPLVRNGLKPGLQ